MCSCYLCFIIDFESLKKIPNEKFYFLKTAVAESKITWRFLESSRRQANDLNGAELFFKRWTWKFIVQKQIAGILLTFANINFILFLLFLFFYYSWPHSPPITLTHPHLSHSILPPPLLSLSMGPLYLFLDEPSPSLSLCTLPPSPLVTVSLFFISMSLVMFYLLVCSVD